MDELKLKLSTKLMRGIVSKLIGKAIYKKYGYEVNIQLNELDIQVINGETVIKTNAEVKLSNEEFKNLFGDLVV